MERKKLGTLGEKIAGEFIRKKGYKILENNVKYPQGEIDIVAREQKEIVFIEVRAKQDESYGSPEESITRVKKERIISLALNYLQKHNISDSWRIEVVAIEIDKNGTVKRVEIIPLY